MQKLLHKIKLFDIIIISLFLVIILSVSWLLLRTKKELKIVIKVTDVNTVDYKKKDSAEAWFANLLYAGLEQKDALGNVTAKITEVKTYDAPLGRKNVYLTLLINSVFCPGTRQYTYNGRNILIGAPIQLLMDKVSVGGFVTDVDGFKRPYEQKKLIITVQFFDFGQQITGLTGVLPYIPDSINIGDTEKDSLGNNIITVIKKEVEEAKKVTTTADGEVLLRRDPVRKDMYLTLEVKANRIDDRYFLFDDQPLLVDQPLGLNFEKVTVYPIITKIDEAK